MGFPIEGQANMIYFARKLNSYLCLQVLPWAIILFIFFLYLLAQHNLVFFYHDDFGLAVLDYGRSISGFSGTNFNQAQLFEFLFGMYNNWSGRILAFFIQINLSKLGIEYVRLFQVIIILFLVRISLKIATNRGFIQPLIIIPVLLYLCLPIFSVAGGLFWFSASSGYLWGVPFMFYGVYRILIGRTVDLSSAVFLALSCGFHELLAIAVLGFLSVYLIVFWKIHILNSRFYWNFILIFFVLLLLLVFLLAPGNFARSSVTQYPSSNFFEIFSSNIGTLNNILIINYESFTINYIFILSFAALLLKCQKAITNKIFFMACAILTIVITLFFLFLKNYLILLVLLVYGSALLVSAYAFDTGKIIFSLFGSSVGVLLALSLSPGIPGRALLLFYVLLFPVVIYSFVNIEGRAYKIIFGLLILMLVPLGLKNSFTIYNGYKINYQVNMLNHFTLSSAELESLLYNKIDNKINLHKLPDSRFAETMPYQRKLIEQWMKKYYSLPEWVEFSWN